ncbi:SigE family RNA polymerase sigma factor [Streptomyces sp. NPDC087908]|uniref:SigE family RNA polymerase sigma factor n=1 Tax=Streptomyces sp. NPDC087908 TaxID=3365820 RepID=UPI00381EAE4A
MRDESQSDEFAEFARSAWPRLVQTAHMLTGDFHEAEDLVQTTLANTFVHWSRIPCDEAHFYVQRALVNNNLSRLRRKRVVQVLMPLLPEVMQRTHHAATERTENRAALSQALLTLPSRQRTVMVLRYFEDLSDPEIASVLDCSLGTVKTHARRGLASLRSHPAMTLDSVSLGVDR